jgi:hypothetical protein
MNYLTFRPSSGMTFKYIALQRGLINSLGFLPVFLAARIARAVSLVFLSLLISLYRYDVSVLSVAILKSISHNWVNFKYFLLPKSVLANVSF